MWLSIYGSARNHMAIKADLTGKIVYNLMIQKSDSMIPTEKGTYPAGILVSPRPEQSARDPKHRHSLGQFISSRL